MDEIRSWKYRVQFERSAVKDRDGFKVEAFDDDENQAMLKASKLYKEALEITFITEK